VRIVNRLEFLKMPPGTVYAEYEPHVFGEIAVKGETWWNDGPDDPGGVFGDFIYCDLTNEFPIEHFHDGTLDRLVKTGEDLPLTFGEETSRDGMHNAQQLYAVWSREDIRGLAEYLLQLTRAASDPDASAG
jgi:hypothetical protein